MEAQDGIVWLNHSVGHFRRRDHRECLHDAVRILLQCTGSLTDVLCCYDPEKGGKAERTTAVVAYTLHRTAAGSIERLMDLNLERAHYWQVALASMIYQNKSRKGLLGIRGVQR